VTRAALFLLLAVWPSDRLAAWQCPDGAPPPCARVRVAAPRVLDPNGLAVLPFRIVGADTAYAEGLAELVALEFPGEGGPRALSLAAVVPAWRGAGGTVRVALAPETARRVAAQLGAAQLLIGTAVGVGGRITLSASIVASSGGAERARARVDGPADSLPLLIPRLAVALLSGQARGAARAPAVGTESPEAMRAYLDGARADRDGRYVDAIRHLRRAVALDSAFALAADRLLSAGGWISGAIPDQEEAALVRLRFAHRDKLPPWRRQLLEATATPNLTPAERVAALERATASAPDEPTAWYARGDWMFHYGEYAGYGDAPAQATAAFARALELDSTYIGPLSHQAHAAVIRGDRAEARRFGDAFRRADSTLEGGNYHMMVRWSLAYFLGDTVQLRELWRRVDEGRGPIRFLPWAAVAPGYGVEDLPRLLAAADRAATTDERRQEWSAWRAMIALNLGHPRAAAEALDAAVRAGAPATDRDLQLVIWALDAETDTPGAAAAAGRLAELTGDRFVSPAGCLATRWRLATGDTSGVARAAALLRTSSARAVQVCADLIDGTMAAMRNDPGAIAAALRADSLMRLMPALGAFPVPAHNLALGRLFERLGDPARGLAAVRRGGSNHAHTLIAAPYARAEGRLAALVADTTGATTAYRYYLRLRADPDPALVPQRDSVRAELARLERR